MRAGGRDRAQMLVRGGEALGRAGRAAASRATTRSTIRRPASKAGFGELAEAAAEAAGADRRASAAARRRARDVGNGQLPLVDGPAFVTGKAQLRRRRAAARHADRRDRAAAGGRRQGASSASTTRRRSRCRACAGRRSCPTAKAPAGFQPLGGVAVVADHTWAALRGRAALDVDVGGRGATRATTRDAYREALLAAVRAPGKVVAQGRRRGRGARRRREAGRGRVPRAAPRARADGAAGGGRARRREVVRGVGVDAGPAGRREGGRAGARLDETQVTVHVTFLGGGFGRKSKPDFVVEAALLSRAVGAPVRVQWTREDDIRHDYYHTVSAQRLEAGLDAERQGRRVAPSHRVPSIGSTFDAKARPSAGRRAAGALDLPLAIARPCASRAARPRRTCGSAGCARSTTSTTRSPCRASSTSWPPRTGRDPNAVLLEVLGPARKRHGARARREGAD